MFAIQIERPALYLVPHTLDARAVWIVALWLHGKGDYLLWGVPVSRALWLACWRALPALLNNQRTVARYERMVADMELDWALEWDGGWRLEYRDYLEGPGGFDIPRYRLRRHSVELEYWQTRTDVSLAEAHTAIAAALWVFGVAGEARAVYLFPDQLELWGA